MVYNFAMDFLDLIYLLEKLDVVFDSLRSSAELILAFSFVLQNELKGVPMGCKDTVLPDPLLEKQSVKCLLIELNTRKPYIAKLCLFRVLPLILHGNEKLEEETSKSFNLLLDKTSGSDLQSFEVHVWKILQQCRILVQKIFSCTTLTL